MKKWERYYEEYYCRLLIERYLPLYCFNKSETPDWIDHQNSVGLECTIAQINDGYATARKYAEYSRGECRNSEKRLEELNRRGTVTNWFYIHQSTDGNALPYIQIELEKKLNKLNQDRYHKFQENWLSIYLENPIFESDLGYYYQGLFEKQQEYETGFDKIFICGSQLFVFDMNREHWQYYTLENQRSFAEKVQEIAMKEEDE